MEPLLKAVEDKAVPVRMSAVNALGEIGDPKALDALKKLKKDKSVFNEKTISEMAKESINKIKSKCAMEEFLANEKRVAENNNH